MYVSVHIDRYMCLPIYICMHISPLTDLPTYLPQAILDGFPLLADVSVTRTDASAVSRRYIVTFASYDDVSPLPLMRSNATRLTAVGGGSGSSSSSPSIVITQIVPGSVQEVQVGR